MLFSTYPTLKCVHAASDDSQCILLTESVAYGNTIGLGVSVRCCLAFEHSQCSLVWFEGLLLTLGHTEL